MMGATAPAQKRKRTSKAPTPFPKLPRLPKTHRIQKRPLLHPPIPSPYAGAATAQKTIYVAARTSFVGVLARVKKLLARGAARRAQSVLARAKNAGNGARARKSARGSRVSESRGAEEGEEGEEEQEREAEVVVLKASGRAIERGLALALALQRDGGFRVTLRTGSVGTVDDVVPVRGLARSGFEGAKAHQAEEETEAGEVQEHAVNNEEEVAETRIRFVSVLEVCIGLAG